MTKTRFNLYRIEIIESGNVREIKTPFDQQLIEPSRLTISERTIQQEIRDVYLRNSIEWLIDFEHPSSPIRAQQKWQPLGNSMVYSFAIKCYFYFSWKRKSCRHHRCNQHETIG